MILMMGVGLAAVPAIPGTKALAVPPQPPAAPPGGTTYLFHDEFDGPAGSAPDSSKWTVARARESMEDPTFWELPENVGQYRDDRRNLFLDGKSNLVLRAAKDGDTYYSGKLFGRYRGGINTTWEARVKFNCLTPGCWPAWVSPTAAARTPGNCSKRLRATAPEPLPALTRVASVHKMPAVAACRCPDTHARAGAGPACQTPETRPRYKCDRCDAL